MYHVLRIACNGRSCAAMIDAEFDAKSAEDAARWSDIPPSSMRARRMAAGVVGAGACWTAALALPPGRSMCSPDGLPIIVARLSCEVIIPKCGELRHDRARLRGGDMYSAASNCPLILLKPPNIIGWSCIKHQSVCRRHRNLSWRPKLA